MLHPNFQSELPHHRVARTPPARGINLRFTKHHQHRRAPNVALTLGRPEPGPPCCPTAKRRCATRYCNEVHMERVSMTPSSSFVSSLAATPRGSESCSKKCLVGRNGHLPCHPGWSDAGTLNSFRIRYVMHN